MSAGATDAETVRPRLNPFAFPSDTTFRFLLLIVAVAGVSLFLFSWMYSAYAASDAELTRTRTCIQQNQDALRTATGPADLGRASDALNACRQAVNTSRARFILGGFGALLLAATLLYLAVPVWKLRRRHLVPFTADDDPEVAAELERLSEAAGLRRAPRFVWNPLNAVPTGLAFGRIGRRYVGLSGGLVTQYSTDRPAFRAVVLHELAHLRNLDVDKTYFTVALWWAFLLVGVAPFVPTLFDESGDTIFSLAWRLVALTGLVYLTRNSVLRAREVYADVRASVAEPPPGALRRVLASVAARPHRLRDRVLGLHPDPAARLRALDDTDPLFSLGLLEAFGTGIAATIAYREVVDLVSYYNADWYVTMWWSALAFAPFVVGVVALGAWRGAFAELARGRSPAGAWRLGIALGAGFLLGQKLALSNVAGQSDVILTWSSWSNVVWALVALVGLVLFVAWITSAAALWLPVAGRSSPRAVTIVMLAAASLVLTVAMGMFFLILSTRGAAENSLAQAAALHDLADRVTWAGPQWLFQFVLDDFIASFAHRFTVWAGVIALWAFPLAALLLRSRSGRPVPWASLDPGSVELPQPRLHVARAVWLGVGGGVAVLASVLALRAGLRIGTTQAVRDQEEFGPALYVWTFSLGLLGQGIVAATTAAVCRRGAVPLALLAAFLTGLGGAVSLFAVPSLASCVDVVSLYSSPCGWHGDGDVTRFDLEQMLVRGTLVAIAAAGIGLLAAWALRQRRERALLQPAPR